jgi:hypothetical protein
MLVFRVATEFFAKIHKTAMVGNVLTWGFRDRVYTSSSAPQHLQTEGIFAPQMAGGVTSTMCFMGAMPPIHVGRWRQPKPTHHQIKLFN